jgi:hypothetical protein
MASAATAAGAAGAAAATAAGAAGAATAAGAAGAAAGAAGAAAGAAGAAAAPAAAMAERNENITVIDPDIIPNFIELTNYEDNISVYEIKNIAAAAGAARNTTARQYMNDITRIIENLFFCFGTNMDASLLLRYPLAFLFFKKDGGKITSSALLTHEGNKYVIYNVCTHPKYVRKGYSKIVLKKIIFLWNLMNKNESKYPKGPLTLTASNIIDNWEISLLARTKFYLSLGFRILPGQIIKFIYPTELLGQYCGPSYYSCGKVIIHRGDDITVRLNNEGGAVETINIETLVDIADTNPKQEGLEMVYVEEPGFNPELFKTRLRVANIIHDLYGRPVQVEPIPNNPIDEYIGAPKGRNIFKRIFHGVLTPLMENVTFQIPRNIELIHITGLLSTMPFDLNLMDVLTAFSNDIDTISMTTLQKMFPPQKYFPITYPLSSEEGYDRISYIELPGIPGLPRKQVLNFISTIQELYAKKILKLQFLNSEIITINCLSEGQNYYNYRLNYLDDKPSDLTMKGTTLALARKYHSSASKYFYYKNSDVVHIPYRAAPAYIAKQNISTFLLADYLNAIAQIRSGERKRVYILSCSNPISERPEINELLNKINIRLNALIRPTVINNVESLRYQLLNYVTTCTRLEQDMRNPSVGGSGKRKLSRTYGRKNQKKLRKRINQTKKSYKL